MNKIGFISLLALAACLDTEQAPIDTDQAIEPDTEAGAAIVRWCPPTPPAPTVTGALTGIRTTNNIEVSMEWTVNCPAGSDPSLPRLAWVWLDYYTVTPAVYTCGAKQYTIFVVPCSLGTTEAAVGVTVPDPWRDRNLKIELGRQYMPSCW